MTRMKHKQKVKMARKMRTHNEGMIHLEVVLGKKVLMPPVSIWNTKAWSARQLIRMYKEDFKRKVAEKIRELKKAGKAWNRKEVIESLKIKKPTGTATVSATATIKEKDEDK